jgi:hypothetical protein
MGKRILKELRNHAPFTMWGAVTGILIMVLFHGLPHKVAYNIFYVLHPLHVLLSALVTASMFKLHTCKKITGKCLKGECNFLILVFIGYVGAIGIATLSDSLIPYVGEALLDMPKRELHIGFIEKWWLVNPLALAGVTIAAFRPTTKFPHLGHVLISTWSSLFHIIMAEAVALTVGSSLIVLVFLFLAVLVPCCTSDIVFPLLFVKDKNRGV